MTLYEFIRTYGEGDGEGYGNNLISIEGYCEEYMQDEVISAEWYDKIKYKVIKRWQTIGGGMYPVEICIQLDDKMDNEREVKRMEKKSFLEIDNILINLDNVYEIRISADNKAVIFYFTSGDQSSIEIDRTNQDLIPKLRSMCK